MPEIDVNTMSALLADFNTKIKDIEERSDLLKEKLSLLEGNFLDYKNRTNREFSLLKDSLRDIKNSLEHLKGTLQHIIRETAGFARKEELMMLERYMKLWEPLKFVRADEVKEMIKEALRKKSREEK